MGFRRRTTSTPVGGTTSSSKWSEVRDETFGLIPVYSLLNTVFGSVRDADHAG